MDDPHPGIPLADLEQGCVDPSRVWRLLRRRGRRAAAQVAQGWCIGGIEICARPMLVESRLARPADQPDVPLQLLPANPAESPATRSGGDLGVVVHEEERRAGGSSGPAGADPGDRIAAPGRGAASASSAGSTAGIDRLHRSGILSRHSRIRRGPRAYRVNLGGSNTGQGSRTQCPLASSAQVAVTEFEMSSCVTRTSIPSVRTIQSRSNPRSFWAAPRRPSARPAPDIMRGRRSWAHRPVLGFVDRPDVGVLLAAQLRAIVGMADRRRRGRVGQRGRRRWMQHRGGDNRGMMVQRISSSGLWSARPQMGWAAVAAVAHLVVKAAISWQAVFSRTDSSKLGPDRVDHASGPEAALAVRFDRAGSRWRRWWRGKPAGRIREVEGLRVDVVIGVRARLWGRLAAGWWEVARGRGRRRAPGAWEMARGPFPFRSASGPTAAATSVGTSSTSPRSSMTSSRRSSGVASRIGSSSFVGSLMPRETPRSRRGDLADQVGLLDLADLQRLDVFAEVIGEPAEVFPFRLAVNATGSRSPASSPTARRSIPRRRWRRPPGPRERSPSARRAPSTSRASSLLGVGH